MIGIGFGDFLNVIIFFSIHVKGFLFKEEFFDNEIFIFLDRLENVFKHDLCSYAATSSSVFSYDF